MQNNQELDNELDLGKIFRLVLMQSKLILLFVFIMTSLSIAYYITTDRTYRISSLLQIYNQDSPALSSESAIDFMLGASNLSDLNNVDGLYKTRQNLNKVISKLNLNVNFPDLKFKNLIGVNKFSHQGLLENQVKTFYFQNNVDSYSIFDSEDNLISSSLYGEDTKTSNLEVNITYANTLPGEKIKVLLSHKDNSFRLYKRLINITNTAAPSAFYNRSTGLVEVSFLTKDRELGKKVVDTANAVFLEENIRTETEKARKAINFINQRIEKTKSILDIEKERLKNFQEKNKSVNVDLEIQAIIQNIGDIETEINKLDLEIGVAENNYTESNPLFQELINQKRILLKQKNEVEKRIVNLPLAQQEYIDLYRSVEISQELYSELLNRQLGFSILEASTLGNIRIVDNAYVDQTVSPKINIVLFSFIFSIFLSFILAIIRGLFFMPVSNPAELPDNGVLNPIIGVLPFKKDKSDDLRFSQSVENLVANIQNKLSDESTKAETILITSPTSSNGKSFVGIELAKKLASLGKKVCLIDLDLKRGVLQKRLNLKPINQIDFTKINTDTIEQYKLHENFYAIPKVRKLSSSFNFIHSNIFTEKMDFLKSHFDYLLIDTAPVLSVSDTIVLLSQSDLNILIARHGVSKMKEIKQSVALSSQVGIEFDGVLYNCYEKPKGYYGYYGLYGNYNYQYYAQKYLYDSYYYEDKDD